MIETNRRKLITGLAAMIATPAIVRAGALMPVRRVLDDSILVTTIGNGGGGPWMMGRVAVYDAGTLVLRALVPAYWEPRSGNLTFSAPLKLPACQSFDLYFGPRL